MHVLNCQYTVPFHIALHLFYTSCVYSTQLHVHIYISHSGSLALESADDYSTNACI